MEKLQARMILEILGRPASNVTEALQALTDRLSKEKGAKILELTIHEPIKVKDANDLYTSFAEIIIELDSVSLLLGLMFAYMPAHAELISPEFIEIKNSDIGSLLNALLQRLHNYDSIAKSLIVDKEVLTKKLFEVAPQLFKKAESTSSSSPSSAAPLYVQGKTGKVKPAKKAKKETKKKKK